MKAPLDREIRHEVVVAAQLESIPHLIDFVSSYAREMAFEEKRIGEIRLALEEALGNIVRFACPTGDEEIRVSCDAHEMGALVVDIVDSGMPFNMLVVSTFPEVAGDSGNPALLPSTRTMKKVVKNIEYRRDGDNKTNILAWIVSKQG
jgi:anti-sigma regulatory factor (Ser/Thr protein kinase)